MGEQRVRSEAVDGIAVISLQRPERHNALDDLAADQWHAAIRAAASDESIRCILLRGDGPSFSSGRDTAVLGDRPDGESDYSFVRRHQQARLDLLEAPKPVVAALHGYVLGGAFETALAADMRVAADDCVLAFPEVQFGLLPDTGGTQLLTPLIGPAKAKYLVMTGERIGAADALRWGIVDWVVERTTLDDEALALCRKLCAGSPQAVAFAKQLVDHAWAGSIRAGMRAELIAQTALFSSKGPLDLRDMAAAGAPVRLERA